jgi:PadR family transcriptional regulator PadR
MNTGPRMTLQTQLVLRVALTAPADEWYGLQMVKATGLPSGTVYPIIARLEQCDWITSRWENPEEHVTEGRPRRRYYRLTDSGAEAARLALANAYQGRAASELPWGNLTPGLPGVSP